MRKEISELEGHKTWNVVPRKSVKKGANVLPSTWAYKINQYPDGRKRKVKTRFCVRGDRQVEGVDYTEKYAPVVSWSTVRLLMTLAIQQGWATKQVDFSNAFVQAELVKKVYIKVPSMFESEGDSVLELNKSLCGLVEAPLLWYNHLKQGFKKSGFV